MVENIGMMDTSATEPQIDMMEVKPYSHRVSYPQGTVVQSPERYESNMAFCISALIVLRTTAANLNSTKGTHYEQ